MVGLALTGLGRWEFRWGRLKARLVRSEVSGCGGIYDVEAYII